MSKQRPQALHLLGCRPVWTYPGGNVHGIAFAFYDAEGKEVERTEDIKQWVVVGDKIDNADMDRFLHLTTAICRYMNTSQPSNHSESLRDIIESLSLINSLPRPEWPKDCQLYDFKDEEYTLKHGDSYIRVVENQFTEELMQEDMYALEAGIHIKEVEST